MIGALRQSLRPLACRLVSLAFRHEEQLRPERMVASYREGRFPLIGRLDHIVWQDPAVRAVIPLDERFRVGKRLRKKIESGHFTVTFDRAFRRVIEACAELRPGREVLWLSPELIDAYTRLHRCGYAHSVEVWREGRLVGGEYGVAIGGLYSGESMFTREDYAGRVALACLAHRLRDRGFALLDTQQMSEVAREFGAFTIGRAEYGRLLADALARDVRF